MVRGLEIRGQVFAFAECKLERECQLITLDPTVIGQKTSAGAQKFRCRYVCRCLASAPACLKIEFRNAQSFSCIGDQLGAPIELSRDIKDSFLDARFRGTGPKRAADAQMNGGSFVFGDQSVSCLLHAIVQELVSVAEMDH